MGSRQMLRWIGVMSLLALSAGCSTGEKSLHYLGDACLHHYKDVATSIDYESTSAEPSETLALTREPHRLRSMEDAAPWDITLEEALHLAVANNAVIRDNAQFLSPTNRLLNSPDYTTSIYDPAIQESNVQYGQRGVEAALAEFDSLFTTNMTWGRSEQVSDSSTIGYAAGETRMEEFGDFRASLEKQFAHGGQISLSHNWYYSGLNSQFVGGRLFPSHFTSRPGSSQDPGLPTFGVEYRHPLWAGAGTEFTRIAGPINSRTTLQNVPSASQGVVIARIRTDISLADFEKSVINLIHDVEDVYWSLYLAYRTYDSEVGARNSALQTWREVKGKLDQGLPGGGAADEAQARDNYFENRARAESSLAGVFSTEIRLRRLLGLPVNDGKILRPVTEPITAEFAPDWRICLVEALTRRVELRRQKWNIKSLELQLKAAQSLAQPRFDFVSRYQVNGFGDDLLDETSSAQPYQSAYGTLLRGMETGWALGFEFNLPIGFRAAHSQVQNIELRLAKARTGLAAQEQEISYELADAFQRLDQAYTAAETNFNRRRAAERRVQAFEAEYRTGRTTLDLLLRAQISLAQAEISYFSSLVQYNQAINKVKFYKGTLLEDNQVYLEEGLSNPEAYEQALRRAWERSNALGADHLKTEPSEFSGHWPGGVPLLEPIGAEPVPEMSDESAGGEPDEEKTEKLDDDDKEMEKLVPAPADPPVLEPVKPERRKNLLEAQRPAIKATSASDEDGFLPPIVRSAEERNPKESEAVLTPVLEDVPSIQDSRLEPIGVLRR